MNKIGLIIKREYLTRVKKKSFIVMTILGPLLMAALMLTVFWLGLKENNDHSVLVIDENLGILSEVNNTGNIKFDYQDIPLEDAKRLFHESSYTCILHIPPNIEKIRSANLFFKKKPSALIIRSIERRIEEVVEELKLVQKDITKKDYYDIKTSVFLKTVEYKEPGKEQIISNEQAWVGFAFGIMIYMFIFLYGVQVMRGVIEEKSSRIVEVIISSVKPFELMMGKIVGVALVGFTQFLLWIIFTSTIFGIAQTTLFADIYDVAAIAQDMQMTPSLLQEMEAEEGVAQLNVYDPQNIINRINFPFMLSMFAFYFLGGYLLYSALFAAVGSAVDSETDTQQFMLPITMPLIFAYILSVFMVQNPESPVAFWASIIPFTSPIVMMVRLANGGVAPWELILSMLFLVGGFVFTTWVAAKIYRTGILMYGKKISYKELWKWLNYKN